MRDYLGVFWVLVLILAANGLWLLISPRSAWRALGAWQYRNPAANEPSGAAFRVYGGVSLATAAVVAIMLAAAASQPPSAHTEPNRPSPEREYEACLERERARDDGFGASPESLCEVYRQPDRLG